MKLLITFLVLIFGTSICFAQETKDTETEKSEPSAEFQWLKQFEGEWATEFSGTMRSKSIGQRWIVNEISFPQGSYSLQTIGYDTKKKKYVGTWVDASSSFIWRYTGSLDATGKILVLEAEGPDMSDPNKMGKYRDTYEFKSENEIALTSQMLDEKKEWKILGKSNVTKKFE